MTALVILTIERNATVPSCIRVPPEAGPASSGSPSRVARSIASTRRSAAATPIEPARNRNSPATTATRRPLMVPLTGDDGFVDAGLLPGSGEFGGILVRDAPCRLDGSGVPGGERAFVEDDVDEFVCVQTWHGVLLSFRRRARRRLTQRPRRAAAVRRGRCAWSRPRSRRRRRRSAAAVRAGRCRRGPGGRRRP
jgi:hypothetical protein